jgi:hypothetical protein
MMNTTPLASADFSALMAGDLPEQAQRLLKPFTGLRRALSDKPVFEYTRNKEYVHQYHLLRSAQAGETLDVNRDAFDDRCHVLVVRLGNLVIGGTRLVLRSPRVDEMLPMEVEGFSLARALPKLNLPQRKYAEISPLVILEEFEKPEIIREMLRHVFRKLESLGASYGFAALSPLAAKQYRAASESLEHVMTQPMGVALPLTETKPVLTMVMLSHSVSDEKSRPAAEKAPAPTGEIA